MCRGESRGQGKSGKSGTGESRGQATTLGGSRTKIRRAWFGAVPETCGRLAYFFSDNASIGRAGRDKLSCLS